ESLSPGNYLDSHFRIVFGFDLNVKSETIQKLWPQFALFRITGTNQHKSSRMLNRNVFSFNLVATRHGNVEQQINEMVLEQVDFVYIKKASVRARQQTRLKSFYSLAQGSLDIYRTTDAIFSSSQRQVNYWY